MLAAPFPSAQGSQRFVLQQARGLQEAGALVRVVAYGAGDGRRPPDLPIVRVPARLSPRGLRSGFHAGKLVADAALAARLLGTHRAEPFDALLAHNAEAAGAALSVRRWLERPVVYVAHTLWEEELGSYLSRSAGAGPRALGRRIDRSLAARADAVVTLSGEAQARLAPFARGPVLHVPPGCEIAAAPTEAEIRSACASLGLEREGFVLYPGNLDGYQNLPLLDAAAERFTAGPVVAVAHDGRGPSLRHLRVVETTSPEVLRRLVFAARLVVVPRRARGGFPIKLLQAMEAARPIVAVEGVADTLRHGTAAWLLPAGADGLDLAAALRDLWTDPERCARLGAGARAALESRHDPARAAAATLELAAGLAR